MALAREGNQLQDLLFLQQFFQPWSQRIASYTEEILLCLQKNFAEVLDMAKNFSVIRPMKTE